MPVIRGRFTTGVLTPERRAKLQEQLTDELSGQGTPGGPLIFEIPLGCSPRFDVIVIWEEFEGVAAEDRDRMLIEAYAPSGRRHLISTVIGATRQEADEQNLLPYFVFPKSAYRDEPSAVGPIDPTELRGAMLEEGGITLDNGRIALRFPTRAMAEDAQERLTERLPRGKWSISERLPSIP